MLSYIIIATVIVGLVSLVGVFVIFRKDVNPQSVKMLISVAAGTLLGAALLDLLPEALEESTFEPHVVTSIVLVSILIFFLLERFLHWHHCRDNEHEAKHEPHEAGLKRHVVLTNLLGDALHNLIDGFVIAAAFLIDTQTGIIATVAVIAHEIPQEIADFGVLLYAGLTRATALLYNFFIALTAVLGALLFYYFGTHVAQLIPVMAAFAAGNFIYLAAADLIPELHHEKKSQQVIMHSLLLLLGVGLIIVLQVLFPHAE
ncbi:MAG: ZIP family metal transporter [Patescibacteria group bacterium]